MKKQILKERRGLCKRILSVSYIMSLILISGCGTVAKVSNVSSTSVAQVFDENTEQNVLPVTEDSNLEEVKVSTSAYTADQFDEEKAGFDVALLGAVEGDVYVNRYFDIVYKQCDGYEFYTDSELKEANGLDKEYSFGDEQAIREMIKKRPNGYYDMMSLSSDGSNVNISIIPINDKIMIDITEEDLVNAFMETKDAIKKGLSANYQTNGIELRNMDLTVSEIEIFGETHKGILLDTTIFYQDLEFIQKQFMAFIVKEDYYCQPVFTYSDESQLDEMLMGFMRLSEYEQALYDSSQDKQPIEDSKLVTYYSKTGKACFSIPQGWKEKALNTTNNEVLEAKFIKEISENGLPTMILFSCSDLYEVFSQEDVFKESGIERSDVGMDMFTIDDIMNSFFSAIKTQNATIRKIGNQSCIEFDTINITLCKVVVTIQNGYMYMFELHDFEGSADAVSEKNQNALYEMVESISFIY